jgi:hypothetical protein
METEDGRRVRGLDALESKGLGGVGWIRDRLLG